MGNTWKYSQPESLLSDMIDTDTTWVRRAASRSVALLCLLGILLTGGVATAAGASTIEGVWSFNGGEIAIQPETAGKYEGIVVSPTTFASCVHPVGQQIWKGISLQSDGSYWGLHQWYKTEACVENPILGPTAYRVVEQSNGSRYLRVCLSSPGTNQPTIPPGSTGLGATYGCGNSALTAPLASSKVGSFKEVVSLPNSKKCFSARKFAIHIRNAKYDPFKTLSVKLAGKRLHATLHGSEYVATVSLRGLPRGAFSVTISAVTFRGNHVSGKRTFHTCVPKKRTSKKGK
jgi:hypothetical protein